jgi:hypothetical protein
MVEEKGMKFGIQGGSNAKIVTKYLTLSSTANLAFLNAYS